MGTVEISISQLFICLIFVVIAGAGSILLHLKLERDITFGAIRTFAQLYIMGYVLKFIFRLDNVYLVLFIFLGMIVFAVFTIRGRIEEKQVSYIVPVFVSMVFSYMLITIFVTAAVIQVKPWYFPRYFIPLGGMIIGNSMNAIAISLERLFSDIRRRKDEIELFLCLGATYKEATEDVFKNAVRAGMIPTINSMMAVGIVFIPGMMTGQILAGTDPILSIKYQIVVMLMIAASTAISTIVVAYFVRRRCFTSAHQIRLN